MAEQVKGKWPEILTVCFPEIADMDSIHLDCSDDDGNKIGSARLTKGEKDRSSTAIVKEMQERQAAGRDERELT